MANNVHIVPHPDGWAVRRAGGTRASAVLDTQADAIDVGRDLARADEVELLIHGTNGQIRARDSYGPDDYPPEG